MKVALVNSGRDGKYKYSVSAPLNIGYIASYLERNNIEVRIIDQLAGQDVRKEICYYRPAIVGITATTPLALFAYRIADMCEKMGILTVMGGVHATVMPEEALTHADVVVVGDGEAAMLDIIKEGITSGIVRRPYIKNLDEINPPARHLMKLDFYLRAKDRLGDVVSHMHFVPPHRKVATMLTTRGCPYACIYCHNSWRQTPVRFHSAERVISEIMHLIEAYGVEAISFDDDNLLANKPRLRKICAMMKENKLDIPWGCNTMSTYVDPETVEMIKEAGCKEVVFGWESGSQRILDVLQKRTTVERNAQAIKLCKQAGLMVTGSFMVGNPTETVEDIEATKQFIRDNMNEIDMYGVNITTPYPGTKLWQWCNEHGLIPQSFEWADFNQCDMPISVCNTIPPKELERLYLETFSVQTVKLSRLLRRGSWHAIKTIAWGLKYPSIGIKLISGAMKKRSSTKI